MSDPLTQVREAPGPVRGVGDHEDPERVRRADRDREASHQAVVSPEGVATSSLELFLEYGSRSRSFEQVDQRLTYDVGLEAGWPVERHHLGDDRPLVTNENRSDFAGQWRSGRSRDMASRTRQASPADSP